MLKFCIFKSKSQKQVERLKKDQGAGKEVSMLIHSMPKESSMYLRHPGDAQEEDDAFSEEDAERDYDHEEEMKELESFKMYIDKHKRHIDGKVIKPELKE